MMPAITRPNGKLYRPRFVRSTMLGNEDEVTGIVVFGTALRAEARSVAELDLAAYSDEWLDGYELVIHGDPEPVWMRRDLCGWEDDRPRYTYTRDEVHGAFGYRFDAIVQDAPVARPDGIMPPPLGGLGCDS